MHALIFAKSFVRRLTAKSAFYFSLCFCSLIWVISGQFLTALIIFALLPHSLILSAYLINKWDRSKKTYIQCQLCGHPHCSLFYPARGKNKKETEEERDRGDFACSSFDHGIYPDIYYCPVCKNGFLKHIGYGKCDSEDNVEETTALYGEVEDTEYLKNIQARYKTSRIFLKQKSIYFDNKDVLEVGSYYGAFYEEARHRVKSYTGIEPSKHACQYFKEHYKKEDFELYNGGTEDIMEGGILEERRFDTIVLFDVMEHLVDPIRVLKNFTKYLRPGGHVLYSTINIESSVSILLGPRWPWLMDMHYYYFSDRGYVDMLHRSGLVFREHSHYGYHVYASYFCKKILYILFKLKNLPPFFNKMLNFTIPIVMGDVVLIIGEKPKLSTRGIPKQKSLVLVKEENSSKSL